MVVIPFMFLLTAFSVKSQASLSESLMQASSHEMQSVLEALSRRVNEALSSSAQTIRGEAIGKVDTAISHFSQGKI